MAGKGKPFEKGREKTGGRKPSTPNKATSFLRERIVAVWQDNYEDFLKDLKDLEPKDRCRLMVDLLQYALPKLSSVEYKDKDKPQTLEDELSELSGETSR